MESAKETRAPRIRAQPEKEEINDLTDLPPKIRKRKFFYIEYRSIDSVYTIPVKRPMTDLDRMGGAYFENQKYQREQFMKEKKKKLAAKEPGLASLSASYFDQLDWLIQADEDENVVELNLDAPMLYAHGAINHY